MLLPGLVNAHTRAATTLLRGAAKLFFDYWLNRQMRLLDQRWMDAEYVRDGTELAIADMLTSGTTCFADMHSSTPEVTAQAAAAAKVRACIGLPVRTRRARGAGAGERTRQGIALHDEYRDDPLITTALRRRTAMSSGRRNPPERTPRGGRAGVAAGRRAWSKRRRLGSPTVSRCLAGSSGLAAVAPDAARAWLDDGEVDQLARRRQRVHCAERQ